MQPSAIRKIEETQDSLRILLKKALFEGLYSYAFVAAGKLTSLDGGFSVSCGDGYRTIFDLASLTKALVTTPLILVRCQTTSSDLDRSLAEFTAPHPTGLKADLSQLTLRELLAHKAAIPAWRNYWMGRIGQPNSAPSNSAPAAVSFDDQLRDLAVCLNRTEVGRDSSPYSDIGFLLLGYALMVAEQKPLDRLFDRFVKDLDFHSEDPFGLVLGPGTDRIPVDRAIPTGYCPIRRRSLQGEVYDENAAAFPGLTGHAGLFASGRDLVTYLRTIFTSPLGRELLFLNGAARDEAKRDSLSGLVGLRLGDDRSSEVFGLGNAVGHLGFTGTAFWLDLERDSFAVLLTNRTIAGRNSVGIREFRRTVFTFCYEIIRSITN